MDAVQLVATSSTNTAPARTTKKSHSALQGKQSRFHATIASTTAAPIDAPPTTHKSTQPPASSPTSRPSLGENETQLTPTARSAPLTPAASRSTTSTRTQATPEYRVPSPLDTARYGSPRLPTALPPLQPHPTPQARPRHPPPPTTPPVSTRAGTPSGRPTPTPLAPQRQGSRTDTPSPPWS